MAKKQKQVGYAEMVRQLESGQGTEEERLLRATRKYTPSKDTEEILEEKMPSTWELFRYGKNWYQKRGKLRRKKNAL